jgi:hypothetical protein
LTTQRGNRLTKYHEDITLEILGGELQPCQAVSRVAMRHADMEGLFAELVIRHQLAFQLSVFIRVFELFTIRQN